LVERACWSTLYEFKPNSQRGKTVDAATTKRAPACSARLLIGLTCLKEAVGRLNSGQRYLHSSVFATCNHKDNVISTHFRAMNTAVGPGVPRQNQRLGVTKPARSHTRDVFQVRGDRPQIARRRLTSHQLICEDLILHGFVLKGADHVRILHSSCRHLRP
jgi:hypothetical protein